MAVHTIKRGLNLPIEGEPKQQVFPARTVTRVGLVAADYRGVKPTFFKQVGDPVRCGEPLFEDKRTPGVTYTAPGAGTVVGIHRGARRALVSVVVELNERDRSGRPGDDDFHNFAAYTGKDPGALGRAETQALLLESGLWPSFRTRPFSNVPSPASKPHAIFVTAMDTEPLAPDMSVVAAGREADLVAGMTVLRTLCSGAVYFCKAAGSPLAPPATVNARVEEFSGPHPAGLPGTHIHFLDPVSQHKTVWHIGLQNLLDIGALFRSGRLPTTRIISLAGPAVIEPRLVRTRIGASTDELAEGEYASDREVRIVSGSAISGRAAHGEVEGYLGRYHNQITVLREGRERFFLGWLHPGPHLFSVTRAFVSAMVPDKKFPMTTNTNGSPRAMVPIGSYERVMPLDIEPTFLLRALASRDIERAEALGILELDEEDLALCTFVCPGKTNWGAALRENLETIEKEG